MLQEVRNLQASVLPPQMQGVLVHNGNQVFRNPIVLHELLQLEVLAVEAEGAVGGILDDVGEFAYVHHEHHRRYYLEDNHEQHLGLFLRHDVSDTILRERRDHEVQ